MFKYTIVLHVNELHVHVAVLNISVYSEKRLKYFDAHKQQWSTRFVLCKNLKKYNIAPCYMNIDYYGHTVICLS